MWKPNSPADSWSFFIFLREGTSTLCKMVVLGMCKQRLVCKTTVERLSYDFHGAIQTGTQTPGFYDSKTVWFKTP